MRWGIIGIGKITWDFAVSVAKSQSIKILACTSARKAIKPTDNATKFAEAFGIPKVLASPDELLESNETDIVYIGARTDMHYILVKRALEAGKAVLCEKPMTGTLAETLELVEYARKRKLFLAEGLRTRYFPAIKRAQELVQTGHIGEVYSIWSNYGVNCQDSDRMWIPGGGALAELGCYTILMPTIFYNARPETVSSVATMQEGVDSQGVIGMTYGGVKVACGAYSGLSHTPCETVINGTEGIIRLPISFYGPDRLEITKLNSTALSPGYVEDFPLPQVPEPYPYIYPNSKGLIYEAEEIDQYVSQGLTESPLMPLEDTLIVSEVMDTVYKQQGHLESNANVC